MHLWFELILNLPGHFRQKEAMIQVFNRVAIFKESSLEFLLGLDSLSTVELFPPDLSIITLLLSVPNVTILPSLMQYSISCIRKRLRTLILALFCGFYMFVWKVFIQNWIYILHMAIILSLVQCFYILYVKTWLHESNVLFFMNIGPDSERQRENGKNQTIRRTWVCINRCFHLSSFNSQWL